MTLQVKRALVTGAGKRLGRAMALDLAERGFDVGYLDRYPDLVDALTTDDVTAAIRRHLRPADLHETIAGTLPED